MHGVHYRGVGAALGSAAPALSHRCCSVNGGKRTQVAKGDTEYIGPVL